MLELVLSAAIGMLSQTPCKTPTPARTRAIVVPLLRDANKAISTVTYWDTPGEKRFSKGWSRLVVDNSREADEAVAILLHFYIGEHPGEELHDETVRRGARMLPLLSKYQQCKPADLAKGLSQVDREMPDFYGEVINEIRKTQPGGELKRPN